MFGTLILQVASLSLPLRALPVAPHPPLQCPPTTHVPRTATYPPQLHCPVPPCLMFCGVELDVWHTMCDSLGAGGGKPASCFRESRWTQSLLFRCAVYFIASTARPNPSSSLSHLDALLLKRTLDPAIRIMMMTFEGFHGAGIWSGQISSSDCSFFVFVSFFTPTSSPVTTSSLHRIYAPFSLQLQLHLPVAS
ncbi:hypothetical protein Hypma_003269 [Hypsizygus marmoreus]|uniref:Secreted protein n=1 Tax=Hypsizygus marmoreus TaxID=39966 RepID=A0A369K2I2_HYPMA|nr:hypothetical protein Hypma_003269 [Hypsizygus marmoreus]